MMMMFVRLSLGVVIVIRYERNEKMMGRNSDYALVTEWRVEKNPFECILFHRLNSIIFIYFINYFIIRIHRYTNDHETCGKQ